MERRSLSKELSILSTRMDEAWDELNDIALDIETVESYYDLLDHSCEILEEWRHDLSILTHKLSHCFADFETFAFDGDSIRESGDKND